MSTGTAHLPRLVAYVRTSTDDKQSPEDSKRWQLSLANGTIAGRAEIVDVVHDIDVSRSQPWRTRPEASRLLKAMANPDRGWEGIVVGEPQRAFGDALQYQVVAETMAYYGIQLWVPELGGLVDFRQEAHDIILNLFGTFSRGERTRLQKRVVAGMRSMAETGRFMGGRPPYGYRLVSTGVPHPNPEKARYGIELQRLDIDPETSAVVRQIFAWAADASVGHREIARRLNAKGIPCPSKSDPGRNPHRKQDGWAAPTVLSLLRNPRYMGTERWGRKTKVERLVDPLNPLAGRKTQRADADPETVIEVGSAIPAIVDAVAWQAAQHQTPAGRGRQNQASTSPRQKRTYPYRGVIICGHCGRAMVGDSLRSKSGQRRNARYVCRARDAAVSEDHPSKVTFSEQRLDGLVMPWLEQLFDDDAIRGLAAEMAAEAAQGNPMREYMADLDKQLSAAERRVERVYELMEDPDIPIDRAKEGLYKHKQKVAVLKAKRDKALAEVPAQVSEEALYEWLKGMAGIVGLLMDSDPATRREMLLDLGLRVEVEKQGDRSTRLVASISPPRGGVGGVGGGTHPTTPRGLRSVPTTGNVAPLALKVWLLRAA